MEALKADSKTRRWDTGHRKREREGMEGGRRGEGPALSIHSNLSPPLGGVCTVWKSSKPCAVLAVHESTKFELKGIKTIGKRAKVFFYFFI